MLSKQFIIWWVRYLFLFLLYKVYYLKSLMRLFIVSIVKREATVITHFWLFLIFTFSLSKIKKYIRTKNKKIQNNNNNEKRLSKCLENGYKLVEEVQKYEDWNLTVYFWHIKSLVNKENWIWKRKVQKQIFIDSIKFYWRFNWIYWGFDCKRNWFLRQFGG